MNYPEPIAKLIESYMKLPGIGQKTATRLAFYTIDMKEEDANAFAKALISVKRDLHFCSAGKSVHSLHDALPIFKACITYFTGCFHRWKEQDQKILILPL